MKTRAAMIIAVLAGCVGAPAVARAPQDGGRPIVLRIKTDKAVYAAGDTIKVTLTVRNTTHQPVVLKFPSAQKFEISLTGKGKNWPDWVWSRGKMFAMTFGFVTAPPDKPLEFKAVIEPEGSPARLPGVGGSCKLDATLTTTPPADRATASTTVTIR